MLADLAAVAIFLLLGNILFRNFEPHATLIRRLIKSALILSVTALISYYFGHTGVFVAFCLALVPLIYVHGFWLPHRGVNGWTTEPKEKYYALRGWTLPPK